MIGVNILLSLHSHLPPQDYSAGAIPIPILVTLAVISLLLAAWLMAVEVALTRLSRAAITDMVEEGRRHAQRLFDLSARRLRAQLILRGLRTACQGIVAVAVTLALVEAGLPWWATAIIALVLVTGIQFLTLSILASALGARRPEGIALAGTPLLYRSMQASRIVDPLLAAIRGRLPQPPRTEAEARAEVAEDLREMVDQVGETEGLAEEDRQMLRSVFELGQTLVREVMVPRTDMVTLDAETPADHCLRLFVLSGFSRIPVTGDDVDDIRGILYFKDLVRRLEAADGPLDLIAEQMVRPAEFTIEMKAADDLLRQMQSEHFHMALVVDEYGGISGLVTLEDLIEEVVGELTDEHDRHVVEPEEIEEGIWRVPSRFPISELGELLGMELEDDDVDSVGGLLSKAIGRVPLPGATGELLGVRMIAEEARGRRRQVGTIVCSRVLPPHGAEMSQEV